MGINVESKDIVKLLNIPKRKVVIVALFIVILTATVIFLPDSILNKLFILDLKNKYGKYIGITFLISTIVLIINVIVAIFDTIKNKIIINKSKRNIEKFLNETQNKAIIEIIRELYTEDDHTCTLSMNNGAVAELTNRMLISLTSSQNPFEMGDNNEIYTNYFLQPFVVKMISDNEKLLKKYS